MQPKVSRRKLLQSTGAAFVLAQAAAAKPLPAEPPPFASVVKCRVMIRAYTAEPIPEELIPRLLEYAVRAPSAGNLQPWEFVVVQDPEVRTGLAAAAFGQTSVATAPLIIATCADTRRMGRRYGSRGNFYSLVNTTFASLLILLGVVEQGLGACSVGTCNPVKVARIPGLPDRARPVGLITIGYPAERPSKPSNPTLPLHMLVHRNTWQGK